MALNGWFTPRIFMMWGDRVGFTLEPDDIHVMEVSQYDKMRIDIAAGAGQ